MQIGFHTANYFARALDYQTNMDQWEESERKVSENFSLAEFDCICRDIKDAGFQQIELWMGHAFPKFMTQYLADELKGIWEKHDLSVYSYSCSLGDPVRYPRWTRLCFETAQMLGIELITSGISKEAAPVIYGMCNEFGIKVAVENHPEKHPEKHPDEIKEVIGEYGDLIGSAVDTGWFETQGFSSAEAIRILKDIKEVGKHQPVALDTGIVDIKECIQVLKEIGYDRTLSIEQESADHDPTDDCAAALKWVTEFEA
jgi:sugar phosphate isomerase/epimerase